ncbi:hypothetical protein FRB95_014094 [Tulasnella sp. JGI-2019a]|nr:hypothetical protein FRB95_014094 [Tulasnella sp. JGI-2019a]
MQDSHRNTMNAQHPCAAEPSWELRDGSWTRPLLAAESFLDQVNQLADGHDEFAFGVVISTQIPLNNLKNKVIEALIRLRYFAPLIASSIKGGIHDHQLRSWVYHRGQSTEEVRNWAQKGLQVTSHAQPQAYGQLLVSSLIKDSQPPELADQPFACHLVVAPDTTTPNAILFHASHALMDGPGALTIFKKFLHWVVVDLPSGSDTYEWGTENRNLPLGLVTATGGVRNEWEKWHGKLMEEREAAFAFEAKQPTHSLSPSRQDITSPGNVFANRKISSAITTQLVKVIKGMSFTITQLFDAAFILATFKYHTEISGNKSQAHITLYPTIVNLRPHIVPLYAGHDIDTCLNICDTGFPLVVPYNIIYHSDDDTHTTDATRLLRIMSSVKEQYARFLSNPHHMYVEAVEAAVNPLRELPLGGNPYSGEITNLGVIERWLPFEYRRTDNPSRDKSELAGGMGDCAGPDLEIKDVVVALRQRTKRPMVHVWSICSELRLQVQASDVWDVEYLGGFLEEIITCACLILGGPPLNA